MANEDTITIERAYSGSPEELWDLWTTPAGIESWWAPEGFAVKVEKLELEPGGELLYSMTAIGPEQIEFMQQAGMPLITEARKTYTEVSAPRRLGYASLIDFVPGHEPYEHLTVIELEGVEDGVHVVMTMERMHDKEWTERLVAGRENELDNLAKALSERGAKS
jgi:uncharacterized protein YndB with AHSA1/START domain